MSGTGHKHECWWGTLHGSFTLKCGKKPSRRPFGSRSTSSGSMSPTRSAPLRTAVSSSRGCPGRASRLFAGTRRSAQLADKPQSARVLRRQSPGILSMDRCRLRRIECGRAGWRRPASWRCRQLFEVEPTWPEPPNPFSLLPACIGGCRRRQLFARLPRPRRYATAQRD